MFSNHEKYQSAIKRIAENTSFDRNELDDSSFLVTGATGLIGTVLVDTLMFMNEVFKSNIQIHITTRNARSAERYFAAYKDNPLFRIVEWDINNKTPQKTPQNTPKKIDFIIQGASNTHPILYATKPIETISTNISGSQNIFELASKSQTKRVVFLSSSEIYGENRGDATAFSEDYCGYINCNALRSGYTESKRLAEALAQAYIEEKKLDIVIARLGRILGPTIKPDDSKGTSQFIRSAIKGEDIILKSEGKQEYSYVYVMDAASAILLLLSKGVKGEAYNIANDEVVSLKGYAEMLAQSNNVKVKFELPNRVEQAGFSVIVKALLDSTKLKKLGWTAMYPIKQALTETVEILRDQIS
ncbi:MAG: NAD-dependent epimerase/dehydratase family protein [Candidatus Nomurabacteria bacterium]|jgi:nucleoside-diphosphate-sugar epimerase|nr:NAD-dependent epimerase/dehydratase family protein [Candidatus Nomurabacteria bacterium]